MNEPLTWAVGDRCFVKGRVGLVVKLLEKKCALVSFEEREWPFECCLLEDLELVPFAGEAS